MSSNIAAQNDEEKAVPVVIEGYKVYMENEGESGTNIIVKEEPVDELRTNITVKEESEDELRTGMIVKEEPVDELRTNIIVKKEPADKLRTDMLLKEEPEDELRINIIVKEEPADGPGTNMIMEKEPADEPGTNMIMEEEPVDEPGTNMLVDEKPANPEYERATQNMEGPDQSFEVSKEPVVSRAESVELSTEQVEASITVSMESILKPKTAYGCGICSYTTYNISNFERHVKSHIAKNDYDNVNGNIAGSSKSEPCTSTPSKELPVAEQKGKICDQCGKYLKTLFGLKLHMRNTHDKVYKYICDSCGKGYNQRLQYRFHLASHSNESIEKCSFCNKTFQGHSSLARHKVTCTLAPERKDVEKTKFVCDICCQDYKTKDRLNYHMEGKHGPKKYSCPQCGNEYAWRSSLKKHREKCR